jgi:hypothetical protein
MLLIWGWDFENHWPRAIMQLYASMVYFKCIFFVCFYKNIASLYCVECFFILWALFAHSFLYMWFMLQLEEIANWLLWRLSEHYTQNTTSWRARSGAVLWSAAGLGDPSHEMSASFRSVKEQQGTPPTWWDREWVPTWDYWRTLSLSLSLSFVFQITGIEPRALYMLGKHSNLPLFFFFFWYWELNSGPCVC